MDVKLRMKNIHKEQSMHSTFLAFQDSHLKLDLGYVPHWTLNWLRKLQYSRPAAIIITG